MERKYGLRFAECERVEETLEQQMAELQRANEGLRQFVLVASHDLQEPLRTVASYVQLLADRYQGKLDADADEFIGYAVEGITRMQRLIESLRRYSLVETQRQQFTTVNCEALLRHTLDTLRALIEENGATVTHGTLPTVQGDAVQLGQVWQNLISNAVKFSGTESPRVHISLRQEGIQWVFSVQDNGIGIEPQYAERIFGAFQRLHTGKQSPGIGLGLAICKKIVERHGGRIWVESKPGQGSTFFFTLPLERV